MLFIVYPAISSSFMATSSTVTEIKERLNIVEVLSTYLPLKKAGSYYKTNCPLRAVRSGTASDAVKVATYSRS
jgi:hypothetical protein